MSQLPMMFLVIALIAALLAAGVLSGSWGTLRILLFLVIALGGLALLRNARRPWSP